MSLKCKNLLCKPIKTESLETVKVENDTETKEKHNQTNIKSIKTETWNTCTFKTKKVSKVATKSKTKDIIKNKLMKYQDPELIVSCKVCFNRFKSPLNLKKHTDEAHSNSCFICSFCPFSTKNRQAFSSHLRKHQDVNTAKYHRGNKLPKLPIPPQPVLSLTEAELKDWFPSFFPKFLKEIQDSKGQEWINDITEVISLESLVNMKEDILTEKELIWKLKLVSAIILDHKGIDYTDFGLKVLKRFSRYPVTELKMMAQSNNPDTFEKMFDTTLEKEVRLVTKSPSKKKMHECDLCKFETKFSISLKKHKIKKHRGKLLSCDSCNFKSTELDELQNHRIKVHIPQIKLE